MVLPKYEFNEHIDRYMRMVENEEIRTCKEQKLLMEFLRWKLSSDDIVIDHDEIQKSIDVPQRYFPFKLFEWQKFLNALIFGVRYKDGRLVFNRFFVYLGRGAGKNGYMAYKDFYMLTGHHGIPKYDIDIVANSEKQAMTSFDDVADVIEDNGLDTGTFYMTKKVIRHRGTKSELSYNTSNARTKDGKRPGCVNYDEIHEDELYDKMQVFETALGKKPDPRQFYFTTDGNVRGGVLDDLKRESLMVLNKELPDSTLLPFMTRLDSDDEVEDEANWEKANPSYRYRTDLQIQMKQEYHDMQFNSQKRIDFMTKRMNRPIEDVRKVVAEYEDILKTDQPIPPLDELKGVEAIGGIDYASMRDFCTVGLLFKRDGKRYWIQHTFVHQLALKLQDINPEIIRLGQQKGLITVVDDEGTINPQRLVNWYLDKLKVFKIKKIALDTYRYTLLREYFEGVGFKLELVRRGPVTHAMLSPLIDDMFVNKKIVFGDDPVMRWYIGNVYKDELGNGNIEYKKIDAEKRKTDGFYAFTHALNCDGDLVEKATLTKKDFKRVFKVYDV